ncbi:hypothetical protein FRB94_008227 [Tulasnella sp. JGI-2019a]|nr:hypothetical protein FRB94_008227 [Tulasnella sp. JGI-2019a]
MGTNTLQSAKVGLQILSTIVKSVPIPEPFKSAVVGIPDAVLQIITIVETAKGNMEDAKVLALYIATMTDRTIRPLDLCSITPVTQRRIHEFQEALQQITEEITTLASQRSPRKWIFHYDRDAAKLYALKQRVVDAIAGIQLETVVATSQEVDIMSQKQDLAHEDHKAIIRKQDLIYQEQLVLVQKQDIIYQEQQDLIRKQQEAEIDRLIALLGSGDSGSSKKPPCLDGTRASLLKWISKWIETIPVDDKRGLCLVGAAGRGKSSVGASVAEDERKLKRLGADFYFTVDQQDRNQGVIPVLARQLASWGDRRLRVEIASVVDDDRDIAQRTLEVQFKKLIQEPLETLKDDPNCPPLVILLDGLDEGGNEYISRLLHLIGQSFARLPAAVRFIITSRPEPHLIHHYASEPLDTRLYIRSLDLEDVGEVERDIEAFFKRELPRMVLGLVKRPSNWPGEQRLRILVRMAGGLWIWAVTVARMLTDQRIRDPERQLDALLSTVPDIHGEYGHNVDLYAVYSMILNRACPLDAHSQLLALFRNVLGALCVVKTPINIHTLVSLLCLDRSSGENIADDIPTRVLGYLQAVLIVPGIDEEVPSHDTKPIRFIHKSFEDYLLDESRYNVRFLVNIAEQHRWMAIRCMRRMDDLQNTNICHLYPNVLTTRTAILWRSKGKDFVFDLARQHISSALLYACENWTTHVSGALPGCDDVYASVDTLARTGLLNWLEVLSLQGRIEKVEELVELVEVWLKARYIQVAAKSPKTHPTASVNEPPIKIQPGMHIRTDAVHAMSGPIALRILMRFLASFLPVQQPTAPPQASTLSTESDVSALNLLQDLKHFVREFKIPIIAGPVHIYHSALPFIPLHTSLSRTYGHLAGGGPRPRRGWLQQWSDHNCCVAWSPDSQRIVSGSWNGTLRLWDPSKGASIGEAWNFHAKKVNCVAWSPDGETLVSGSDDCTLQLWDSTTGGRVGEAWKGHTDGVLSVAWSPDGKRVVSGSADRTLRMWDPSTGAPIGGPWKSRTLAVRYGSSHQKPLRRIPVFLQPCLVTRWEVDYFRARGQYALHVGCVHWIPYQRPLEGPF